MRWMKVGPACEHLGGVSAKTLYAAVRRGDCQAARIGAGRNLLFSEEWLDQYARARSVKTDSAMTLMKRTA
jgi:hypothetical protein